MSYFSQMNDITFNNTICFSHLLIAVVSLSDNSSFSQGTK